jgi:hypothetical protein
MTISLFVQNEVTQHTVYIMYTSLTSTAIPDPTRELCGARGETALWEQHDHVQSAVYGPHHLFNKYSFVH